MARSIRIELAGGFYHLMARGNRRNPIYLDDDDRRFFLKTLAQTCEKTGWRVHAWVLMSNHYHLFVETPEPNLVDGMKWLQNTYTRRFNVRHGFWGRLFGDRYKSILVEGAGFYYETLMDYIHLNPARAKLVSGQDAKGVMGYPWCSVAGGYALAPGKRAPWLAAADGLAAFGFKDTVAGRRGFIERLNRRMVAEEMERAGIVEMSEEVDRRCSHLRRGWYWGSQAFAEKMLEIGEKILRRQRHWTYRQSMESKAHGELEAERILKKGLILCGLKNEELGELPGSDVRKVAIALKIRQSTTVRMEWINDMLKMKSAANVRQQIWRMNTEKSDLNKLNKQAKDWLKI
jgi:putative transposase